LSPLIPHKLYIYLHNHWLDLTTVLPHTIQLRLSPHRHTLKNKEMGYYVNSSFLVKNLKISHNHISCLGIKTQPRNTPNLTLVHVLVSLLKIRFNLQMPQLITSLSISFILSRKIQPNNSPNITSVPLNNSRPHY